jgi:hypothetical protein
VFPVGGVHVLVAVTIAEIGATLWIFLVLVGLSNWLCSRLLWKPPWHLPALVEIIDAGLDDVVGNEDQEHEAADVVPAESTVPNAAAPPALAKDIVRQLSKTGLKNQVIVQFPWDPGGSELLHRLGGKPKLKKRGMSGTIHDGTLMWAMGLGQVKQWPARQLGITYKRIQGAAAKDQQPKLPEPCFSFTFTLLHCSSSS